MLQAMQGCASVFDPFQSIAHTRNRSGPQPIGPRHGRLGTSRPLKYPYTAHDVVKDLLKMLFCAVQTAFFPITLPCPARTERCSSGPLELPTLLNHNLEVLHLICLQIELRTLCKVDVLTVGVK